MIRLACQCSFKEILEAERPTERETITLESALIADLQSMI